MNTMAASKHDNIPTWDGEGRSFLEFCEQCRVLQRATKPDQRPLLAAKVVQKLTGPARTIAIQRLDQFEHATGLEDLLLLIEQTIGRTPVSAVADDLEHMLGKIRRRQGEGMMSWSTRVWKANDRLEKALRRLRQEQRPGRRESWTSWAAPSGSEASAAR